MTFVSTWLRTKPALLMTLALSPFSAAAAAAADVIPLQPGGSVQVGNTVVTCNAQGIEAVNCECENDFENFYAKRTLALYNGQSLTARIKIFRGYTQSAEDACYTFIGESPLCQQTPPR
jgi:hypothetical protein